jgi:hypothetical protein
MDTPKYILQTLNNLYEIERKIALHGDMGRIGRNVDKIKDAFQSVGFFYEDPLGAPFRETRTDLDATISGQGTENLYVAEVIKPIIRYGPRELSTVVQKGIVLVQSRDAEIK